MFTVNIFAHNFINTIQPFCSWYGLVVKSGITSHWLLEKTKNGKTPGSKQLFYRSFSSRDKKPGKKKDTKWLRHYFDKQQTQLNKYGKIAKASNARFGKVYFVFPGSKEAPWASWTKRCKASFWFTELNRAAQQRR